MSDPRRQFGLDGERRAETYLRRRGLRTIARRFNTPVGELDLVMRDGRTVVFVEVKTRRDRTWAEPEDAVSLPKQQRMARAAAWFLRARGWEDRPCRFDVVAVVAAAEADLEIRHFPDAFFPS